MPKHIHKKVPTAVRGKGRATQNPRTLGALLKAFVHSKKALTITAAALAGVCVVVLAIVVLLPASSAGTAVSNGASTQAPGSSASSRSRSAFVLDPEVFVGTVLPETEDAGIEYVEETLFLGDSNTVRMMYYSDITGVTLQNCIGEVGMGITTFCTQKLAQFEGVSGTLTMPQAVELLQPRRVVITFGTNNVGLQLDVFLRAYREALEALKQAAPHTDIIIGSVFPVDEYRQNTKITPELIDEMNEALAELAKEENVKFLNWSEALVDTETGYSVFEYTLQDGVHLTRVGMKAIFDYFRTHSYITEDTRPTTTKDAPRRLGIQPGVVLKDPYKIPGPIDWSSLLASSSSSSEALPINVIFTTYDEDAEKEGGGTLASGGETGRKSLTMQGKVGDKTPAVVATPATDYEFVEWRCEQGGLTSPKTARLEGYSLEGFTGGETIYVVAVFRPVTAASNSASASGSGASSVVASSQGSAGASSAASSSDTQAAPSVAPPASSKETPPASSPQESTPPPAPESQVESPASIISVEPASAPA